MYYDISEVLESLYSTLDQRSKIVSLLKNVRHELQELNQQSYNFVVLDSVRIVLESQLSDNSSSLCSYIKSNVKLFSHSLSPESHNRLKENLEFLDFLKSGKSFDALLDSVIQKGDRWDENP